MPAVQNGGHVDVDDVAIAQRPVGRNAMADDLVDRDAAAMRETAIAQRGRHAACLLRHLVDNCVEVVGAGTGNDMRGQTVEHIGGKTARLAHTLERSEEHTSELQSLMRISYAVFCLKKKKKQQQHKDHR